MKRTRPGTGGSSTPTAQVNAVDASIGTLTAAAFATPRQQWIRWAETAAEPDARAEVFMVLPSLRIGAAPAARPVVATTRGSLWLSIVMASVGLGTDTSWKLPGPRPRRHYSHYRLVEEEGVPKIDGSGVLSSRHR